MIQYLFFLAVLFYVSCANDYVHSYSHRDLRRVLSVPNYKLPLENRINRSWIERDVVFENVSFNGRTGERIDALVSYSLLAKVRPAPALILMSGSNQKKEDFYHNLNLLRDWADKGFFIICIDRPSVYSPNAPEPEDILQNWGRPVYDLVRTLDYIFSRTEADSENIGMLGISLGSMEALWLGALDDRLNAVVAISGHLVWPEVFQSGSWRRIFSGLSFCRQLVNRGVTNEYAMKSFFDEYSEVEVLDASNVVSMWKPMPLFIMAGGNDLLNSESSAKSLYSTARNAFGAKAHYVDFKIYDGVGHNVVKKMEEDALKWFEETFQID
ncbi:MAG: prolyl oligopeptidase family serine peptidase [Candidatus Latescibacterota bacterium]|nr:prolyl oligopeptidase family serine peptidase [Candidatus Latescibacterota bacterium]